MKGKVVVGGSFLSADAMKQAKEVGVAGLVVGGIHDKDLRALLGYDLGVAITGTEQVGFTLILTEGFGDDSDGGQDLHAALRPCRTEGVDFRCHPNSRRCDSSGDHHSPGAHGVQSSSP